MSIRCRQRYASGAGRGVVIMPVSGFSLIEVLVVLVIVGVVIAAVTLSIGGGSARELEQAAQRARALVTLACERAVLSGRDLGFTPVRDGLRFGYYLRDGWQALPDSASDELRPRALGQGIELRAQRDGESLDVPAETPDAPAFACLSSGELTPFTLELLRADVDQVWRLEGRLDAALELQVVARER